MPVSCEKMIIRNPMTNIILATFLICCHALYVGDSVLKACGSVRRKVSDKKSNEESAMNERKLTVGQRIHPIASITQDDVFSPEAPDAAAASSLKTAATLSV